jgi:hypothetical protein
MSKSIDNEVNQIYGAYPKIVRDKLLTIRELIFDLASSNKSIGEIEETIKWGEPSYLTSKTKSGSTIRLGWNASKPEQFAIYFNCKTTLVDSFKEMFGTTFKYAGNRCIWFNLNDQVPMKELSICLSLALTYHLDKKKN